MKWTQLAMLVAAPISLTLGVSASGCSSPFETEPQFWPGDGQLGAGGTAARAGSGTTGGSTEVPAGGTAPSGTAGVMAGAAMVAGAPGGGAAGATAGGAGSSSFGGFGIGAGGSRNAGGASSAGSGGTTSSGGAAGGSSMSSANCSLTVKVTTAAAGGRYAPRNIGAVWIADQSGNFIRSLEVWALLRARDLSLWNSAASKAGAPGSRVDIVSQATLSTHMTHTSTWNCQDYNKRAVPDGTYRVYFEMTDQGKGGPNRFEAFTKGGTAATSKPADDKNFKSIELSFKP